MRICISDKLQVMLSMAHTLITLLLESNGRKAEKIVHKTLGMIERTFWKYLWKQKNGLRGMKLGGATRAENSRKGCRNGNEWVEESLGRDG